ncbi:MULTISPECIES: DUF1853 family protein [Marinomonas]|uniref:DUF1853 family protein n=1 Tax=Marinomonas arctica TaxID=383750 RepID=A0A7H1J277_9GAMM|nr:MULTISPECIES: DUF1853 family protein [Marinomonas]MCS7488319.1 hypothetical protein [Marinomonas sp. BSi20414]QNT04593.1 DUF1853 family protein [Marinomonas arctica]GGN32868.1 hypothetical protein GCM10011350_27760 [Marinomonas arctica]
MISDQLHHPLVKDLAWLVEGHYIERDFYLEAYWVADVEARLLALDQVPAPLINALAECKSHFLGSYFESLFSFAIEHLSCLTVIREHFQITGSGKTLGEVDMLVETPDGALHQFEIAVKFYLERPDLFPHDWIGPNKNDSLLKKVTRAREHQLQILQMQEGFSAIAEFAKDRVPQTSLLIFGRLYLALNDADDVTAWLAQTEHGGWIRVSQIALLMPHFSYFSILQKPHWLANQNITDNFAFNSLQSAYNLVSEFLHDSRPIHVLLWRAVRNAEHNRNVFIVPDSW